ncbi:MAG: hypothetical protein CBB60_009690 [Armatimonadetes bacterium Cent15-Ar3]|nr:MAG: hypothetical protein CBB60_009690 [Armatimonadetes bacterium Cent15-Ar3]
MQYFVTGTDGNEYGPVDLATLQDWVRDNRVVPTSKVRNATNGMVLQASTMPEVSNLFPPAPVPTMGTVAPMAGYESRPSYAQPDMTAQMMRNYNDQGWKPFGIALALSLATLAVGVTIGFLSIFIGSYAIQMGWKAKEEDQQGGWAALIIAVVCTIAALVFRFTVGPIWRQ